MIDEKIWRDPKMKEVISEFRAKVRQSWKKHTNKHFKKRERNYGGLKPKLNHRFLIAPFDKDSSSSPRLANALVINWTPESGHIGMNIAPIMVRSQSAGKTMSVGTRYGKSTVHKGALGRVTGQPAKARDLIRILSEGTNYSPNKYVVMVRGQLFDARIRGGRRKATNNTAWYNMMYDFVQDVNGHLEQLANKLEERVADKLVNRFDRVPKNIPQEF